MSKEAPLHGDILIVDDVPANLHLLAQMLAECGYKVHAVRNGPAARTSARGTSRSCFSARWRMWKTRSRCSPLGGDYITKPFRIEEVLARVGIHLSLRRLARQLEEANAQLAWQIEELQARNAELDAFSHTVAHDIKGPLTMIIGHAELLLQYETLPEEMRRNSVGALRRGVDKIVNIWMNCSFWPACARPT